MGGTAWEALLRTLVLDSDSLIFNVTLGLSNLGEVEAGPECPSW